ncbi:AAA family ATPase [Dactylosporangium sp. CA-092794]|uniref:AAA family ATPase n=1 Tax=Dactylosporangium sp. CA-092794 TaxID=3239929 RepID=UPI003D8E99FA
MTTPTGAATAVNPVTGLPRLRPGELQAQVLGVLAANSGKALNIGEIARQLHGRSTGAVGQACDRLVELGHATKTVSQFAVTTAGLAEHRANPGPAPIPPVAPPAPQAPTARPAPAPATTGTPVARPTAAPAQPKGTTGPVRRPNGQLYYPRRLAKRTDVDVLRDLRTAEVPVLLYGPPGTGKTSLIEAAFGQELYTVPGDGDTTVGDIIGDYVPTDTGGYEFIPGPLPRAMEAGGVLFIDDATLIAPKVLAVVYPAMDGRRQIILKAHAGKVITARSGFYVAAGHNPGVHGAVLTEALASRFSAQVKVSTDYDLAAALGVDARMVRAARNLATRFDSGDIGWAPQLRELLAFKKITDVLGVDTALANLVGVAPVEDRDAVVKAIKAAFANTVEPLALGKQL